MRDPGPAFLLLTATLPAPGDPNEADGYQVKLCSLILYLHEFKRSRWHARLLSGLSPAATISVPKALNEGVLLHKVCVDFIIRQLRFVVFTRVVELLLLFLFRVNVVSAPLLFSRAVVILFGGSFLAN